MIHFPFLSILPSTLPNLPLPYLSQSIYLCLPQFHLSHYTFFFFLFLYLFLSFTYILPVSLMYSPYNPSTLTLRSSSSTYAYIQHLSILRLFFLSNSHLISYVCFPYLFSVVILLHIHPLLTFHAVLFCSTFLHYSHSSTDQCHINIYFDLTFNYNSKLSSLLQFSFTLFHS